MAEYTVFDNATKRTITFDWNDPNPPTESDLAEVFDAAGKMSSTPTFQEKPISTMGIASPSDRSVAARAPSFAKDTAMDLAKGVVGLGESVVGVADIATGNLAGKGLAAIGYDPETTKQIISSGYSPERQAANLEVEKAKGFVDTLSALVDNPSVAFGNIVESAPMSIGSAAVARRVAVGMLAKAGIQPGTAAATKFFADPKVQTALIAASSGTEGALTAGSIQEQGRQAGKDWTQTVAPALGGGLITSAIGVGTSKIPGLRDAEVAAATTGLSGSSTRAILASGKEIAKGMFKEGVLEELPQSAQEQVFTNLALGKPWDEGIGKAAAQGLVAGMGMGGSMNLVAETGGVNVIRQRLESMRRKPTTDVPIPDTGITDASVSVDDAIAQANAEVSAGWTRQEQERLLQELGGEVAAPAAVAPTAVSTADEINTAFLDPARAAMREQFTGQPALGGELLPDEQRAVDLNRTFAGDTVLSRDALEDVERNQADPLLASQMAAGRETGALPVPAAPVVDLPASNVGEFSPVGSRPTPAPVPESQPETNLVGQASEAAPVAVPQRPTPPNSIITQVNGLNGQVLGYEVTPHDGTPEGMQQAALQNARAMNNYPEASNNETIHLVTGANGDPTGIINARFGDISPLPGQAPVPSGIPQISREDAIAAKQQVVSELATVDPESARAMQLQIQLDQYNQIIGGEAAYQDFQAPPIGGPSEPNVQAAVPEKPQSANRIAERLVKDALPNHLPFADAMKQARAILAGEAPVAQPAPSTMATKAKQLGKKEGEVKRGEIGGKLAIGEVVTTASGRKTTPFPKFDFSTNGKASASEKRVAQWFMDNAIAEAEARGDDFNLPQFKRNRDKPSQSDKDSAEMYLFGEEQPKVVPSILKPLVRPAPQPESTAATIQTKPAKPAPKVDRQKDDIIVAISKLGGIDTAQASREWGSLVKDNAKDLAKHVLTQTRRFGHVFKKTGLPLDQMRETLVGHGYLPESAGINDLFDAIDSHTRGRATISTERDLDSEADRMAKEYEDRLLDEFNEQQQQALNTVLDVVESEVSEADRADVFDFFDQIIAEQGVADEIASENEDTGRTAGAETARESAGFEGSQEDVGAAREEIPSVDDFERMLDEAGGETDTADKITPDKHPGNGSIVTDGTGREYLVMQARHNIVNVAPIVNGKAEVNADSIISFNVNPDFQPASDATRTEPLYATGRNYYDPAPTTDASDWKQDVAVKGDKRAPTIGGVQKQGGKRASTSDLMDAFTPEPAGLFDAKPVSMQDHIVKAVDAGADAINEIFKGITDPNKLGSGPAFDDETYQRLKPHLVTMWSEIRAAGFSFKEAAQAFAKQLIDKFGAKIKPFALKFYGELADAERNGTILEGGETDGERGDLERDSQDAATQDALGQEDIQPRPGGTDSESLQRVQDTSQEGFEPDADSLLPRPETATPGERSDKPVRGRKERSGTEAEPAGSDERERSGDAGDAGIPAESVSAEAVAKTVERPVPVKAAKGSIDADLPQLHPGQREDVAFAEARFSQPDGYGVMFTNGTGTGKTALGLGIARRFVNKGKKNILIVAPNQDIIAAWVTLGKNLNLLDLKKLNDTKDNGGSGAVITTYANLGQNTSLARRNWDLIITDEADNLSSNKDGNPSLASKALQALSLHPGGAYQRAEMLHPDLAERRRKAYAALNEARKLKLPAESLEKKANAIDQEWQAVLKKTRADVQAAQGENRTRVAFLSATPFAYEKSIDYAEGYLFSYGPEVNSQRYNSGNNYDRFMMQHFGYRMRYNKLTEPPPEVDRGIMQRQFNAWLKRQGVLSGRILDVDSDYDRKFVLIDSAIGSKIDDGLKYLQDNRRMGAVAKAVQAKFDHLSRRYLLEAIKAEAVIPLIKDHLALGRQVVVFHDFNKGGGFNPFDVTGLQADTGTFSYYPDGSSQPVTTTVGETVREFMAARPDLIKMDLGRLPSPLVALQKAFPDILIINGTETAKNRKAAIQAFQDDNDPRKVIIVQSDAGKAGISLHDTTGSAQRVTFNLGLPTKPVTSIQQEGRTYRIGQASNAMFRYLNTGTNWERYAFATTIANRTSAAENLALGESARALRDAFIEGFQESDTYPAGHEGEGTGGKERDRLANSALTEWDRATAFYFGQKKGRQNDVGADYFATPEPLGLKMVEWAGIRSGDSVLEPSGGHGAIARWFPEDAKRRMIEPSLELASRAALVFDGDLVQGTFEDHNIVNKYNAIVMNPPFGSGGRTAVDHLAKAAKHLKDGGRIVAIIPTGPAADKKFDKWLYEEDVQPVEPVGSIAGQPIYSGDTANFYLDPAEQRKSGIFEQRVKVTITKVIDSSSTEKYAHIKLPNGQHMPVPTTRLSGIEAKGKREKRAANDMQLTASYLLPSVTFERAGTAVMTRVVVLDKNGTTPQILRDWTDETTIKGFFDRIQDASVPDRIVPEAPAESGVAEILSSRGAKLPEATTVSGAPLPAPPNVDGVVSAQFNHTKTGAPIYVATVQRKLNDADYKAALTLAKRHSGHYSGFNGAGAIRGFHFGTAENRDAFVAALEGVPGETQFSTGWESVGSGTRVLNAEAINRVQSLIAQALPGGKVTLNIVDHISPPEDAKQAWGAHGKTSGNIAGMHQSVKNITTGEVRSIITLAMDGATDRTGYHEVQHAAESLGLLSAKDIGILERQYPAKDGVASSERRADAFADHVAGKQIAKGYARLLFDRIKAFIRKVKGLFQGQGWRTADDVFNDLMSGKLKRNAQGVAVPAAGTQFMTAWHGSPHDFEKFKTSQIGTGEGAQAYGYGLYFAGNKDVAEYYRDALSGSRGGRGLPIRDTLENSFPGREFDGDERAEIFFAAASKDALTAKQVQNRKASLRDLDTTKLQEVIDGLRKQARGRLYQVELAPAEDEYLLWDKPLSEQSEKVKEALKESPYLGNLDSYLERARNTSDPAEIDKFKLGSTLYREIAKGRGRELAEKSNGAIRPDPDETWASSYLHSLGIRGIKYLDGTSRNNGGYRVTWANGKKSTDTLKSKEQAQILADSYEEDYGKASIAWEDDPAANYNYVIFSDEDVNITSKFSLKKPSALPEETATQRAWRKLQDRYNRVQVLQDWLDQQGVRLSELANAARGIYTMNGKIADHLKRFMDNQVAPLIKEAAQHKIDLDDISDYLLMQHTAEANAAMRKLHDNPDALAFGVTDADAKQKLAEYKARPDFPEFKKLADRWQAFSGETADMLQNAGIISDEMREAWNNAYRHYVPVRGEGNEPRTGKGLRVSGKQQRRSGHGLRDEYVLENIIKAREAAVKTIEKNNVSLSVAQLIHEAQDDQIGTIGKPEKRRVFKNKPQYTVFYQREPVAAFSTDAEAERYIDQQMKPDKSDLEDFVIHASSDPTVAWVTTPMLGENEINAYINGHQVRIQINDDIAAKALTGMGEEHLHSLLMVGKQINNYLSRVYTGYDPRFTIRNTFRDFTAGMVNLTGDYGTATAAKIALNYPRAVREFMKARHDPTKSQWVNRYRKQGGSTGASYLNSMERVGEDIRKVYREQVSAIAAYNSVFAEEKAKGRSDMAARTVALAKSGISQFHKVPVLGHFLKMIETMNAVSENAFRVSTFMTLVEEGKSEAEAGEAAKNSTINFDKRGEWGAQIGALWLFYNPAIQGINRTWFALSQSEHRRQAQALVGSMALVGFLAAEWARMLGGGDDDEWEKVPRSTKNRNLVIRTGDKSQVTIPLPYEYGSFVGIGYAINDMVHGKADKRTGLNLASTILDGLSAIGNPVTDDGQLQPLAIMPTVPKMILAPTMNLNSFGNPIAPEKDSEGKPDSQNMWRGTKGTMYDAAASVINEATGGTKYSAGAIDISPEVLKFYTRSILGGAATFIGQVVDLGTVVANDGIPETAEIPIASVLARENTVRDTRRIFWEIAKDADKATEEYRSAKKARDFETAGKLKVENADLLAVAKIADQQAKLAKAKRDAIDAIRLDDTLSIVEKRTRTKELERQEEKIYDRLIQRFELKKGK